MLIPGLSNKDAESVFVGTTAAAEVYLGTVKVWPTVTTGTGVMGENLVINTDNNTYTTSQWAMTIPAAATKFDVVMIAGGGGGGDGGTLGPGEGGGCGTWKTATYTVGTDYPAGHTLKGSVGAGGLGGAALTNTSGKPGEPANLLASNGVAVALSTTDVGQPNSMPDRTGATPPDCVFNGRTYKGGAGGVSANQNGVNGQAPGGGGQGGNNEVTGNYGGKGGSGGIYLFFY